MGFYGNITNTSRTQFQFDKIYPNRVTMDNNAKEDNIYIGRYVLIEYDSSFGRDWADIVYQKSENEFYTSPNFEEETKLNLELLKNTYIRVRSTLIDIIYYINDEAEPIKISELSQEFNSYTENYNIDIEVYGPGRGYDSTVWQKTFVNGVEKYVMIAELNTIVPTFDLSIDAPTEVPITPHFDADSTNVYYKLHWQPSWGFRVNEIDYNQAGFAPETISKSKEIDSFTVTPTGVSGNLYNGNAAPDIQELSIILPSIGNSIAKMWDIVYGDEKINGSKNRNMSIEWQDGSINKEPTGLRLVNIEEDGYSYNEERVNTLAGVINSVHDLMGMIIHKDDKADANTADITEWKPDYIYYLSKNNGFYRKVQQYNYTEFNGVITDDMKLYVIDDPSGQFIKYSEWNTKIDINLMPNGFKLGTRTEEWVLKKLEGFARNYNTIHGLILRLNELLDKENINSLLVQDLLNKFNALTPKAMLGTDELGQLTSVKLIGDKWINVDDWAKKENGNEVNIKHIQKENNGKTEENSEKNLNFGSSFTISEPDISYDAAGHIDSYTIKGTNYTLPTVEALQEIVKDNEAITTLQTSVENNKTSINNLQTSVENNKTSINNLQTSVDGLEETLAGYGDIESSIETINEIKNINYSVDLDSNEKIKSISQNAGKVNVEVETITPKSILGFTPVQQGSGTNQGDNKVYIGWATDSSGLKVQVENTDLGYISTTNGNGPALPINKGGTGAKNALDAITNLKGVPVINAQGASYDMNTILDTGVYGWYKFNVNTLNTPYKAGLTSATAGYILNIPTGATSGTRYGTQFAIHTADSNFYLRCQAGEAPLEWKKVYSGTIPVASGGTGATDAATARSNLGITPANIGAAPTTHNQSASTIISGTLSTDRLPTIPVAKGGTGATDAATARSNLGITLANLGLTASATELNYMDGVVANVQTQINSCYNNNTTRNANTVLAAPNGSNGTASFRNLTVADLPTISVAKGGTGATNAATARSNLGITPANIGAQPALGYTPARIDLVNSGGTVNSGGQFSIGTVGYNAKILHTTIDDAPAIIHINQNVKTGTIFASKYLASTDDMIFYTIGLNSITESGMVTVSAIRIIQIDHTGINSISNTQFGLGAVYAIS